MFYQVYESTNIKNDLLTIFLKGVSEVFGLIDAKLLTPI